jgi:hypothetical protein
MVENQNLTTENIQNTPPSLLALSKVAFDKVLYKYPRSENDLLGNLIEQVNFQLKKEKENILNHLFDSFEDEEKNRLKSLSPNVSNLNELYSETKTDFNNFRIEFQNQDLYNELLCKKIFNLFATCLEIKNSSKINSIISTYIEIDPYIHKNNIIPLHWKYHFSIFLKYYNANKNNLTQATFDKIIISCNPKLLNNEHLYDFINNLDSNIKQEYFEKLIENSLNKLKDSVIKWAINYNNIINLRDIHTTDALDSINNNILSNSIQFKPKITEEIISSLKKILKEIQDNISQSYESTTSNFYLLVLKDNISHVIKSFSDLHQEQNPNTNLQDLNNEVNPSTDIQYDKSENLSNQTNQSL